jgi:hypothetical protein
MAAPTVNHIGGYGGGTTNATTFSNNTFGPANNGVNVSCVIFVSADGSPTLTVNASSTAGWVKLGQASQSGGAVTGAVFYLENYNPAFGSPTLNIDSSASEQYSARYIYFDNPFVVVEGTSAQGSSTNSNPPSHTLAGGVTKDTLWLASRHGDGTTQATAQPSGYSALETTTALGMNGASTAIARLAVNADQTEDPGTFTSANEQWVSWTVGVYIESTTTTLTAVAGSYAVTGTAATLTAQRKDAPTPGAYAYTGTAATLAKGRLINAALGSYALTGTAATFRKDCRLVAAAGSYALTGTAATLRRSVTLTAAVGSYAFTGTAATFATGRGMAAAVGSYLLSGVAAVLKRGLRIVGAVGSYAHTGTAAALKKGYRSTLTPGSYSITGTAASFLLGRRIAGGAGSYSLTGTAAALRAGRLIGGAVGSYAYTGTAVTLTKAGSGISTLTAAVGSYIITFSWAWAARDPGASTWSGVSPTVPTWAEINPASPTWITTTPTDPTWSAVSPTSTDWS